MGGSSTAVLRTPGAQLADRNPPHSGAACYQPINKQLDCMQLFSRVEGLMITIAKQNEMVSRLTSQLCLVLSFLNTQSDIAESQSATDPLPTESIVVSQIEGRATAPETGAQTAPTALLRGAARSFAEVLRQSVHSMSRQIAVTKSSLRQCTSNRMTQTSAQIASSSLVSHCKQTHLMVIW